MKNVGTVSENALDILMRFRTNGFVPTKRLNIVNGFFIVLTCSRRDELSQGTGSVAEKKEFSSLLVWHLLHLGTDQTSYVFFYLRRILYVAGMYVCGCECIYC